MSKFSKKKGELIVFSIILGFSILLYPNFNLYQVTNNGQLGSDNEPKLKTAGYWEIGPILIDDDDPTKNWTITEVSNEWCSGSGLINDPYIIENVTIDASGFDSGIFIENSNIYFIVRNCSVYNANSRGIRLNRVDHGNLHNNTSSQNNNGIFINRCNFINITNNYILDNSHNGLELSAFCDDNTISGNIAINNDQNGIVLRQECLFNNITNNTVSGHTRAGILIQGESNNNNIKYNTVNDNPSEGISLYWSHHNNVSVNKISNNKRYGILVKEESSNNIISQNSLIGCGIGFDIGNPATITTVSSNSIDATNLVNGKPLSYYKNEISLQLDNFSNAGQVILLNCIKSSVSNLNLSYGGGISLYFGNNNEIIGNTVNHNYRGISLMRSDSNTISGNTANNNENGIYLWDSDHNVISGNILIGNDLCINEIYCVGNTITNNNCGEEGIPFELIILISVISGGAAIGVATLLLIRRKRKRKE